MHNATTMRSAETKRYIMGNDGGTVNIEYFTQSKIMTQVCTLYKFHHNKIFAIGLSKVEYLYNIWMLQGRCGASFAFKASHKLFICAVGIAEHFRCDDAI